MNKVDILAEQFNYHLNKATRLYREIFENKDHINHRCEVAKKVFNKFNLNIKNYYVEIREDPTTDWRPAKFIKIVMTIDDGDMILEYIDRDECMAKIWYDDVDITYGNWEDNKLNESWSQNIKDLISEWLNDPNEFIFPYDRIKYKYWIDENKLQDIKIFNFRSQE